MCLPIYLYTCLLDYLCTLQGGSTMTIYDISLTISPSLPTWPGDPGLILEQFESMDKGAHANVTSISTSLHLGTHVDAPHHFLNNHQTVENLPLDVLCGQCYVVQLPDGVDAI